MNYAHLKHGSRVLAAFGGLAVVLGGFAGEPLVVLVGGSTATVAGLAAYFFGIAQDRQRRKTGDAPEATSKTIAMLGPTHFSETHGEIDEAAKHLAEGRPDVTIELLEKIRKRKWDLLSGSSFRSVEVSPVERMT